MVIERGDPAECQPVLLGLVSGSDVDVVEDLEVVGHEADRTHQCPPYAGPSQRFQQVGTQPGLAGVAGGLKRELPFRQRRSLRHEPAALEEPLAIGIARRLDARRKAVRGEEDSLRLEIRHGLREQCAGCGDERRLVVEATHDDELLVPRLAQR